MNARNLWLIILLLFAGSIASAQYRPPYGGSGGGGSGTVTNVSSANGNATVANPTTTPVITIVNAPTADEAAHAASADEATTAVDAENAENADHADSSDVSFMAWQAKQPADVNWMPFTDAVNNLGTLSKRWNEIHSVYIDATGDSILLDGYTKVNGNIANQYGLVQPYKTYVAIVDFEAGTATILQNTLGGTPTISGAVGNYAISLTGAFPSNKTFVLATANPINDPNNPNGAFVIAGRTDNDSVEFITWGYDGAIVGITTSPNLLCHVEIRVYP